MKNKLSVFATFLCLSFSRAISAADMHAILVADTIDGVIHFETNVDLMQRAAKRIAAKAGYDLHVAVFESYDVRIGNLLEFIEKLNVKEEDLVLFYINNHGSNNGNGLNKWQNLLFNVDSALYPGQGNINFATINQCLKDKKPRLLISMAESCNVIQDEKLTISHDEDDEDKISQDELNIVRQRFESQKGPSLEYCLKQSDVIIRRIKDHTEDEELDVYRQLFVEPTGTMTISSSSPGEVATHGVFTPSFVEELELADMYLTMIPDGDRNYQWTTLLDAISKDMQKRYKHMGLEYQQQETQNLQYELDLHSTLGKRKE